MILNRDIGAGHAWKEIIYPGMKQALINTMLATQDVTEYRKVKPSSFLKDRLLGLYIIYTLKYVHG